MIKKIPICMPVYNRPSYLRQVLVALSKCIGLDQFQLIVTSEPDCPDTEAVLKEVLPLLSCAEPQVITNTERRGCNGNVLWSLKNGFSTTGADWAICLEDDIVLAKDALKWLAWAMAHYGQHPSCFSVCTYQAQRGVSQVNLVDLDKTLLRGVLLPWGWAISKHRFTDAEYWWERQPEARPGLWDDNLCYWMEQKMMFEVCPVVSRSQNIGVFGFNSNTKEEGYGSVKHWKDYQKVDGFISDTNPDYQVPTSYTPFDPAYIDAFRRTYLRKRGIKMPVTSGTIVKIER